MFTSHSFHYNEHLIAFTFINWFVASYLLLVSYSVVVMVTVHDIDWLKQILNFPFSSFVFTIILCFMILLHAPGLLQLARFRCTKCSDISTALCWLCRVIYLILFLCCYQELMMTI